MSKNLAKERALKDIRAELKKSGLSFISVSCRQLQKERDIDYTDIYWSHCWWMNYPGDVQGL